MAEEQYEVTPDESAEPAAEAAEGEPRKGYDWDDAWIRNLRIIDDALVELYGHASDVAGDITERALQKVQKVLDKTEMDEKVRASWNKAKQDGKQLAIKVENRVQHLIASGRITLAKLTKKAG